MRWLLFTRKQETPAAEQFDQLLDELLVEFDESVATHREKLEKLREALR